MQKFDTIIVGARCSGSPLSIYLGRAGLNVLLVDQVVFPSDTLSTHIIFDNTVAALRELGVMEKLTATDTPPISGLLFRADDLVLSGPLPGQTGESHYCFRRNVFDQILIERAKEEKTATVREGFRVTEVIMEDGVAVGVRGKDRAGQFSEYRARIVIGADGHRSTVRQAVGCKQKESRPSDWAYFAAYYRDVVPLEHPYFELIQVGVHRIYIFPTTGGQHLVAFAIPRTEAAVLEKFKGINEDGLLEYITVHYDSIGLPARLGKARLVEPVRGLLAFNNYWQTGMGPGWALVGDATYFRDPATAQGMHDAIHEAKILAELLLANPDWESSWETLASQYQASLEELNRAMYQLTLTLTEARPISEEEMAVYRLAAADPALQLKFFSLFNRDCSIPEFQAAVQAAINQNAS